MKILGFDLGDGESAVTLLDEDSTVEPRVMPLCGKNSLISAVGVKDGRIVIGEAASVTDGAAEAKVRFKSRYLTDPAASADVRAFAQGVMNELVRTQPALMAEVSRTVVGCPAGWGDGRRPERQRRARTARRVSLRAACARPARQPGADEKKRDGHRHRLFDDGFCVYRGRAPAERVALRGHEPRRRVDR